MHRNAADCFRSDWILYDKLSMFGKRLAVTFTWTKDPDKIIAAVNRGHQVLDSLH